MSDFDATLAEIRKLLLEREFGRAVELVNPILSGSGSVETAVRIAGAFTETGYPSAGLDIWRQLHGKHPDSTEIAFEYARVQLAVKHYSEAAATFRHILRRDPDLASAHLGLSLAYLYDARWMDAEAAAREAVRLTPNSPDAFASLSRSLSRQGAMAEAVEAQNRVIELAPGSADARVDLGMLLRAQGDRDAAEEAFAAALAIDGVSGSAAEHLSTVRLEQQRFPEAIELLETAVSTRGQDRTLRGRLAEALYHNRNFAEAERHYRILHETDLNDVGVYAPFAAVLAQLDRPEEAVTICDQGLSLQPDNADIRRLKGQALFYLGRDAEGLFQRLPGSLLPPGYFDSISFMLRESLALDGDVIECGVYKGGATVELAKLIEGTSKVVHACDTFEGIPEPSEFDNYHIKGDFGDTSLQAVETRWKLAGVANRIVPHKGLFEETFPSMTENRYCFAFLDADFYVSMLQALDHVYTRIAPGGWIVIDDYGWIHCAGCKIAVDEFLADKPERENFSRILGCLVAFRKL